jgi:serine/threonine-protein kinase PknG
MSALKCQQPNCDGLIEGGFCNRCGLEHAGMPVTVPVTVPTTGAPGSRGSFSGALSGRPGSTPSRRRTERSSSRRHLGLGLVHVPALPAINPEQAVLAVPEVPAHKRFCPNLECHDGEGNPTPLNRRQSGHCPQCGRRYSFLPTLQPGDVVAEQYEVRGCLAYGGLGWIYLAKDNTLGRWVVLKGLLNTADESAAAAAVAERQFLAAVKHPNIVGIYNFVKRGAEGFIVMEYVGGSTLKDIRKQRGPLPPAESIACVHRVLGAFSYLHRQGLVYCDFKPENFMIEGDPPDVKLIDMGGVRRLDDLGGDVYGTQGYSAPEAAEGPTVASDLYTVGRTLAVLLMDFRFQKAHQFTLPAPAEQPVLAAHEPLHRFLLKATAREPEHRFQSAEEMSDQLGGVLRAVAALAPDAAPGPPVESAVFSGDLLALQDDENVDAAGAALLPELKVHAEDPAAPFLLTTAAADPQRRVVALRAAMQGPLGKDGASAELPMRLARTLIDLGALDEAEALLAGVVSADPFDWRVLWYRGRALLLQGKPDEARSAFDTLYSAVPGEPAAMLAVALAAEQASDYGTAGRLYDLVSRIDPTFVTASFGLARCLLRTGKRDEAVQALGRVPPTSSLYAAAQAGITRALIRTDPSPPGADQLRQAAAVFEAIDLPGAGGAKLRVEVLETALALLEARALQEDGSLMLLGQPFREVAVRKGLEGALRQLARLQSDRAMQIALIDRANAVRPVTWL